MEEAKRVGEEEGRGGKRKERREGEREERREGEEGCRYAPLFLSIDVYVFS